MRKRGCGERQHAARGERNVMSDKKRLLFVVGSLRRGSFNRILATHAAEHLADQAEVEILEYADVPLMNQDIEFPAPAPVSRVRASFSAADAVWFFSPEYNRTMTAPMKNVIDWMSRPLVAGDYKTPLPLTGKPAAISGVGGANATAGSRAALRALLEVVKARPVQGDGEGFSLPAATWATGVYEIPAEDAARLDAQADGLLAAL